MKKLLAKIFGLHREETGDVNMGGILMMGIGMVFLAVGFIMFPIATTATDNILNYQYAGNATIRATSYTGLTAITGITPLLILLGFISAAVITGFLGFKIMKSGAGSTKMSPGGLLLSGLSIVFIALGLIIFPVTLDGISSVYSNGGKGISASYTGLQPILLVTPMLVELAFVASAVISGFFGIKSISNAK